MNVTQEIAEAQARATALREAASACSSAQGPLKVRLIAAAESLQAMTLLAVRSLDRIEQRASGPTVEILLIQAMALLEDARDAAEGGDPATHTLQRLARELVGAALQEVVP